jgi:hypothetical protein
MREIKMKTDLARTKDIYEVLAEATESEPKKELAMGKLFEYAEKLGGEDLRNLIEAVGGKALLRAGATEFKRSPPSDEKMAQIEDEMSPEDIEMVPRERIYVYSYKTDTEDETRGDLSSVYTMYIEDGTGVPFCACPEIARGGVICHHMMLHAVRYGSCDKIAEDI